MRIKIVTSNNFWDLEKEVNLVTEKLYDHKYWRDWVSDIKYSNFEETWNWIVCVAYIHIK